MGKKKKGSPEYGRCLAEAMMHHASSKTYSGKFLRPHAPAIKDIMDRLDCKSVLDYGCGKGVQYQWVSHGTDDASIPGGMTIEQYWGRTVTKYDPGWPPFAKEPAGPFDLVICTHVLGSIPIQDLDWVFGRLVTLGTKAVYIAEKIGPVGKKVFTDTTNLPRWTRKQWEAFVRHRVHNGCEVTLCTREKRDDGQVIMTREIV